MRKQDIEFQVYSILERVTRHQPIEDDRVELKTEWPRNHFGAARRIAAHANTAHGEPILWLIGVDEKRGVVGADFEELSNWFHRMRKHFDEALAPHLISLAVPYQGMTVVALLFETDRAPFVIRTHQSGAFTHEVPWREANSTRSARRSDLLKMLYPIRKNPKVELLEGTLNLTQAPSMGGGPELFQLDLDLRLYVITYSTETVVFPFHRCQVALRRDGSPDEAYFEKIQITPPTSYHAREFKEKKKSLTVSSTESEVLIDTAGMIHLSGEIIGPGPEMSFSGRLQARALLTPHHTEQPLAVMATFVPVEIGDNERPRVLARWRHQEPGPPPGIDVGPGDEPPPEEDPYQG